MIAINKVMERVFASAFVILVLTVIFLLAHLMTSDTGSTEDAVDQSYDNCTPIYRAYSHETTGWIHVTNHEYSGSVVTITIVGGRQGNFPADEFYFVITGELECGENPYETNENNSGIMISLMP